MRVINDQPASIRKFDFIHGGVGSIQHFATQWLWTYNNDPPNMEMGGKRRSETENGYASSTISSRQKREDHLPNGQYTDRLRGVLSAFVVRRECPHFAEEWRRSDEFRVVPEEIRRNRSILMAHVGNVTVICAYSGDGSTTASIAIQSSIVPASPTSFPRRISRTVNPAVARCTNSSSWL